MTANKGSEVIRLFRSALSAGDWPAFRSLLDDGAVWSILGNEVALGKLVGADRIAAFARKNAALGLNLPLAYRLKDGKITELESGFSNICCRSAFVI